MANIYKKTYTAFQRHILAEVFSKQQLDKLDKIYNEAKVLRELRKLQENKLVNIAYIITFEKRKTKHE